VSDEEPQPWWLRALAPLRSEEAMFRVLLWVAGVALVFVAVYVIARAIT
jgi:hypothetical protein